MVDNLPEDDYEAVELRPRHRRHIVALANGAHIGLLLICGSAVYTLQPPTFTMRRWAALGLLALVMLVSAAVTRGRSGFTTAGKLVTAFAAVLVLGLSYDPQLANLPVIGERLPGWLAAVTPGLGTIGVIIAAVFGLTYLNTINSYQRHRHSSPLLWGLNVAALMIVVLGIATYACLQRAYELDPTVLALLIGNSVQYYLVAATALALSGRIGVGGSPQVYLALTILVALARNVIGASGQ